MRAKIKAMNYGLAYGLSAFGLGAQLGIDPGEARGLMDEYFETFGGIRDYLGGVVDQARRSGYTETIMGRRRYLPDLTSDNRQRREMAERMALNAPIQGSAADLIKIAMLNVDRAIRDAGLGSRMLLQVHDELVFEVAPGEKDALDALVREQMGSAADLLVPARRLGRHRPRGTRPRTDCLPPQVSSPSPWRRSRLAPRRHLARCARFGAVATAWRPIAGHAGFARERPGRFAPTLPLRLDTPRADCLPPQVSSPSPWRRSLAPRRHLARCARFGAVATAWRPIAGHAGFAREYRLSC